MRDRRLRVGAPRRSRLTPAAAAAPGAQPCSGNPQLLGNLAQRPAAAYQKPQSLPLEFIRILTTCPSNTFLLLQELIRGVHPFEGGLRHGESSIRCTSRESRANHSVQGYPRTGLIRPNLASFFDYMWAGHVTLTDIKHPLRYESGLNAIWFTGVVMDFVSGIRTDFVCGRMMRCWRELLSLFRPADCRPSLFCT
jgi:hypothetical protein